MPERRPPPADTGHGPRPEPATPAPPDPDPPDEAALLDMARIYGVEDSAPKTETDAALARLQPLLLLLAWAALALIVAVAGLSAARHAARGPAADPVAFPVVDGIRFNDAYALAADIVDVWAAVPARRSGRPTPEAGPVATLAGQRGAVVLGSAERNTLGFVPVLLDDRPEPRGAAGTRPPPYGWVAERDLRALEVRYDFGG